MSIQYFHVNDLSDFFKKVNYFAGNEKDIWYRGHKHYYYNLKPSAYRNDQFLEDCETYEQISIAKAKSGMFHILGTDKLRGDLNWLCYLQHTGAETRLLDWTFDISSAFYFAFEDHIKEKSPPAGSMPCIWVLKLHSFASELKTCFENRKGLFNTTFIEDNQLKSFFERYHPKTAEEIVRAEYNCSSKFKKHPFDKVFIPFLSPFVHERPKAQGGCFIRFPLLHKKPRDDFEDYWLENFFKLNLEFSSLAQLVFVQPERIFKGLSVLNLDTTRVYPEDIEHAQKVNRSLK